MIEPANPSDASAIADCVNRSYSMYIERMGKPPGPMLDNYPERIENDHVWVVRVPTGVAGLLVIIAGDDTCLLDNVAVDPAHAGKGIGKALVSFAENWAQKNGYAAIELYTHELMTENVGMYENWGYQEIRRVTEKGYDRIYMEKRFV